MKIDFFEKQIATAKMRFNQTFGRQVTCDLFTRQKVILSILHMDRLLKQISNPTGSRTETKSRIRRLIKTRDTLDSIYDAIEEHQKRKEVAHP